MYESMSEKMNEWMDERMDDLTSYADMDSEELSSFLPLG